MRAGYGLAAPYAVPRPPPLNPNDPTIPEGHLARLAGLRVGLDARRGSDRSTGVSTYASTLAYTLSRAGAVIEPIRDGETDRAGWAATVKRWSRAAPLRARPLGRSRAPATTSWQRVDLFREAQVHFNLHGRLLRLNCPDPPAIMHWTYPLPLTLEGAQNVYTIHDAIPFDHPHLTAIAVRRHRRLLARISETADLVITVSEHSRAQLTPWLPGLSRPILNTYQAIPPLSPPSTGAVLPADLAPGGYLLTCGLVEPRKNIARLVAAHRESPAALPLVIVGPDGWRAAEALPRDSLGDRIMRLPWLERPQLIELMRQARAVVFPSLAEGFGLPALEAMTLGVPVLASNRGGLKELAAGAALMVEPLDVASIAAALKALSTDDALCARLTQAGRDRAKTFSVAAYAGRLSGAYGLLL